MTLPDDREDIVRRLRAASPAVAKGVLPAPPVMPSPAGADADALTAAFAEATRANQSEIVLIDTIQSLPAAVAHFLREKNAPMQAVCEDDFLTLPWREEGMVVNARAPQDSDSCGITGAIGAAASNGVLLLADNTPRRLTLSLTPAHHIAVLPASAIEPDLPALWRRLPQPLPRGCVLAAGPSRTADIEQTLTLGAHGPVCVLVAVVRALPPAE